MSSQVYNGDAVILNYSNFVFGGAVDKNGDRTFQSTTNIYNDGIKFIISKLNWSYTRTGSACSTGTFSTSCGTMSAANAGEPLHYGDLIMLNYNNNAVSVGISTDYNTVASYPNYNVINNCSKGMQTTSSFQICDNVNYTNSIWCVVSVQGVGYLGGSDHKQKISSTPLTYGSTFFLQSFAAIVCSPNNKNKYFWCNTGKGSVGTVGGVPNVQTYPADIASITNTYPNAQDAPGCNFVLFPFCNYSTNCIDNVCNPDVEQCGQPLCQTPDPSMSVIKSGQYLSIYSSQSALPVAISGSSDHTLGFNDTGQISPGQNDMTFLIKKINISDNSFYLNSDPNSTINLGDPFCLFSETASKENGLVYTAGNYSYPGGYNNILINGDIQIYNTPQDCQTNGSAYATWCFVGLDGTGNVSGDDPSLTQNTGIETSYGQSYIIQNYGKGLCNTKIINAVKNFPQYVANYIESNDFWHQDGNFLQYNTPNLNLSSMSSAYPINDVEYYFYCVTYKGGITYTEDMDTNSCTNCDPDNCDVSKGCCGCDPPKNAVDFFGNIFQSVLIILAIIIGIVILIIIIIVIIMAIKSATGNKNKTT